MNEKSLIEDFREGSVLSMDESSVCFSEATNQDILTINETISAYNSPDKKAQRIPATMNELLRLQRSVKSTMNDVAIKSPLAAFIYQDAEFTLKHGKKVMRKANQVSKKLKDRK